MKIVLAFFIGWVTARFGMEEGYPQGYLDGIEVGHLQGVAEGFDAGHLRGLEEGKKGCYEERVEYYEDGTENKGYAEGVIDGYGEGFFAGVHKGFECKMRQIDAFNFEC
jgi:hypothetical protein